MERGAQVDHVVSAISELRPSDKRHLIAIAGPPASGKSTLAVRVRERLINEGKPCGLVPMDGFHFDNAILRERGLFERKGAPETFDISGFIALVGRLQREDEITIPVFDREKDRVFIDAGLVRAEQKHIIIEGNYLFLDDVDWRPLRNFWSLRVFLAPSIEALKNRLVQRWLDHGLSARDAEKRATENDLKNARLVLDESNRSLIDLTLT